LELFLDGIRLDRFAFGKVVLLTVKLGDLNRAFELQDVMKKCRVTPNVFVYNVLGGLCTEKMFDEMLKRELVLMMDVSWAHGWWVFKVFALSPNPILPKCLIADILNHHPLDEILQPIQIELSILQSIGVEIIGVMPPISICMLLVVLFVENGAYVPLLVFIE
jgi:hypothetical protein